MSKPVGSRNRAERPDAYPEGIAYRDDGCSLHPACLSCPLPVCRHDVPGGTQEARARMREVEVAKLHEVGYSAQAIALALGISKRSVHRMLQLRREAACKDKLRRGKPDGE